MEHFPIFLDLKDRRVVVLGGGEAAAQKLKLLICAGARPLVVAPILSPTIARWIAAASCEHDAGSFRSSCLDGAILGIAASGDLRLDAEFAAAARARGVLVNVVDRAAFSDFIMPAIVDRCPVIVAVSTGGASPTLAQLIRARIEELLPANLGRFAALLGALRPIVHRRVPEPETRRGIWRSILQSRAADLALEGREEAARAALAGVLDAAEAPRQ